MCLTDSALTAAVDRFLRLGDLPEDAAFADSVLLQTLLTSSDPIALNILEQPLTTPRVGLPGSRTFHGLLASGRIVVIQYFLHSTSRRRALPPDSLAIAALHGHLDIVKLLSDHGFNASICGRFGTPLRSACLAGHYPIAQHLLDVGVPVDDYTAFGSALQAAAMCGDAAIVDLLCSHGADINLEGGFFGTALQAASYHGHTNVVKLLLDRGASPDGGHFAANALCAAAEGKSEDALLLILRHGYIFKFLSEDTKCARQRYGQPYVSVLRASSPSRQSKAGRTDVTASTLPPVPVTAHIADARCAMQADNHFALYGFLPGLPDAPSRPPTYEHVFKMTLPNSYRGRMEVSVLQTAAKNGLDRVVKILLEHRSGLRVHWTLSPLASAAHAGRTETLEVFRNAGVDVIADREMALEAAAVAGHLHVLKYLLQLGGGLGSVKEDEVIILLKAGLSGREQILRFALSLLLDFFASADRTRIIEECLTSFSAFLDNTIVDSLRPVCHSISQTCLETTYSSASISGNASGVKAIENFCAIVSRAIHGRVQLRCLEEAAMQGHTAVVETILSKLALSGSGVSLPVEKGKVKRQEDVQCSVDRALIVAALRGDKDTVILLLSHGGNPNKKDEIVRGMQKGERPFNFKRPPPRTWPIKCTAVQACLYGVASWPDASHEYVLRLLIQKNADVRPKVRPSRFDSCDYDHLSDTSNGESFHTSDNYSSSDDFDGRYVNVRSSKRKRVSGVYQPWICEPHEIGKNYSSSIQAEPPLHVAMKFGSKVAIKLLVDAGATVKDNELLLTYLCREDATVETFHYLLSTGMPLSTDFQGQRNAIRAISSVFENTVSSELRPGLDPEGHLTKLKPVAQIVEHGPGALAKEILERFPSQRCVDNEFALLLQIAACAGDIALVELLIDRGVNINAAGYYYGTALQAASRHGYLQVVQALLDAGADVNTLQGRWSTALRAAARAGNVHIVDVLLAAGADPRLKLNGEDPEYLSQKRCPPVPLAHLAVRSGNLAVLQRVLSTGAPPIELASEGDLSCVETAVIANDIDMLCVFLEACNACAEHSQVWRQSPGMVAALRLACQQDSISLVDLLSKYGKVVNKFTRFERSALSTAVQQGNVGLVNLLLESGADPEIWDDRRENAVGIAVKNGDFRILPSLLSRPISRQSLHLALELTSYAKANVQELVKELTSPEHLSNLADERFRREYAVAICDRGLSSIAALDGISSFEATQKAKEIAGYQAKRGMPTFEDYFEYIPRSTPALLLAAFAGSLSAVRKCLETVGLTGHAVLALYVAAHRGHVQVVETLLEHGMDAEDTRKRFGSPSAASVEGLQNALLNSETLSREGKSLVREYFPPETERVVYSTLHRHYDKRTTKSWIRRSMECEEIVYLLKSKAATFDQEDLNLSLQVASKHASSSLVEQLLDMGADPNSIQKGSEPPLLCALRAAHWQHAPLLVKHGAEVNYVSKRHGTALHFACQSDHTIITKFLLQHGADPNILDKQGDSALSKFFLSMGSRASLAGATPEQGTSCGDLLLQSSKTMQIRSRDAAALIKRQPHSRDEGQWLRKLLALNPELTFTSEVLIDVLHAHILIKGEELGMFLDHADPQCSPQELLREAKTPEAVDGILRRFPKYQATKKDLVDFEDNLLSRHYDRMIVRRLLEHNETLIADETTILVVLRTHEDLFNEANKPHILDSLWDRDPTVKVTDKMLIAANTENDTQALLRRRDPAIPISETVILGIARKLYPHASGAGILRILLNHNQHTRAPREALFQSARSGWTVQLDWLEILLAHDSRMPITEAVFLIAFERSGSGFPHAGPNDRERLVRAFENHQIGLRYTSRMRRMVETGLQTQTAKPLKARFFALNVE